MKEKRIEYYKAKSPLKPSHLSKKPLQKAAIQCNAVKR